MIKRTVNGSLEQIEVTPYGRSQKIIFSSGSYTYEACTIDDDATPMSGNLEFTDALSFR